MVKPNPVLGIIGGGQLGGMLAVAAKKLKIKTIILSEDPDASAKNFCEILFVKLTLLLLNLKTYPLKFLSIFQN